MLIYSLDESDQVANKKVRTNEWNLGKRWNPSKILRLNITHEEFVEYVKNHKALATSNLLDIRGYGSKSKSKHSN